MKPKILIGSPTYKNKEYCLKEYSDAVKKLTYENKEILIVDNSENNEYLEKIKDEGLEAIKDPNKHKKARDRIVSSRNILREKCLKENFDYFLSLEQDVIPPPSIIEDFLKVIDFVKKEKNIGIKIITAVYFNNKKINGKDYKIPLVYVRHPEDPTGLTYISKSDLEKPKIMEVKGCGVGCILIHRDVLEKVKFRYEGEAFDDMMFCKDSVSTGFKIWTNTRMIVNHLPSSWEGIEK